MSEEIKPSEKNREFMKEEDYVTLNSLDGAHRYLDDMAAGKIKQKPINSKDAVTRSMPEDRKKYLQYAIRLMEQESRGNNEREILYLKMRIGGATDAQIAQYCRRPIHDITAVGRVALKKMEDCIARVRGTRIPLLEGSRGN
jgi:hypothetical protein